MNYNKLTSLVANVEAIETAVQIHVQGRTATTDEKERYYPCTPVSGVSRKC